MDADTSKQQEESYNQEPFRVSTIIVTFTQSFWSLAACFSSRVGYMVVSD